MKVHYSVFSVFMIAFSLLGHCVLVGNPILHAQTINSPTLSDKVGVKITFPKANSTVPVGTLTINGTSSDTTQTDCRVSVDWNDLKPMQNVTAAGINGTNDYSSWNFTYDQKYHIIAQGTNELTSKIICTNNPSGNTTTKFYSINITGTLSNSSSSLSPAPNVPAALNQTVTNSSGYHTISYQGILPQYDRAMVNDDLDYVENDKSSNYKNDDKAIANSYSDRVPKLSEDAEQEDSTEIVDTPVEDAEQEDSTEIEILKDDIGVSDLSSIHISNPDKENDLDEEPHLVSNQQLEENDKATAESNYQHETISGFYSDIEDSIQPNTIKEANSDLKAIKDIDLKDYKDKKGDDTKKKDKKSDAKEKKFSKKPILKKPSNIIEVIDPFKDT